MKCRVLNSTRLTGNRWLHDLACGNMCFRPVKRRRVDGASEEDPPVKWVRCEKCVQRQALKELTEFADEHGLYEDDLSV